MKKINLTISFEHKNKIYSIILIMNRGRPRLSDEERKKRIKDSMNKANKKYQQSDSYKTYKKEYAKKEYHEKCKKKFIKKIVEEWDAYGLDTIIINKLLIVIQ